MQMIALGSPPNRHSRMDWEHTRYLDKGLAGRVPSAFQLLQLDS